MNSLNSSLKHLFAVGRPSIGGAFINTHSKPFVKILHVATGLSQTGYLKAGHIALQLSAKEGDGLMPLIGPLPDGDTPKQLGHQPNRKLPEIRSDDIQSEYEGKPFEYLNTTWPALDRWAPQAFNDRPRTDDLGELTPQHLEALARVAQDGSFDVYSLQGDKPIKPESLTAEDLRAFLTLGQAPRHAPNCVDFLKAVLLAWARLQATPEAVMHFAAALADCRFTQNVQALATAHFRADEQGTMRFVPGTSGPTPQPLSLKPLYGKFLEASGLSREVFDTMCDELSAKGLIFGEVFERDEAWGTSFFGGLGQRLRACQPNEAVAAICYHQNTYPGNVTHVSMMAFAPDGQVSVCHHESIQVSRNTNLSNLMPSHVGVPSNTYDTLSLHKRVLGEQKDMPSTLPIRNSYNRSGPPMVQFTHLTNHTALRDFNDRTAHESFVNAKALIYGTDPDQHLLEKKGAFLHGQTHTPLVPGRRFPHEPLMLPPGEHNPSSAGAWTNNCATYTLRCLQAGGCTDLPTLREPVSELRLSEVAQLLLEAGLMPCTVPNIADIMDDRGYRYTRDEGVIADEGSFLALAYHWSLSPDNACGTYPPHVPRNKPEDTAQAEAQQTKRMKQLDKILSDNQASMKALTTDVGRGKG